MHTVQFQLYEVPRIVKFKFESQISVSTERRIVVIRGWGKKGNGDFLFNGYRISVWEDEKILVGGVGCLTV